jgi:biotin transport system substrate-specific component
VIATRLARVPPFERGITLGDFLVPIRLGERASSWQRHVLMIGVGTVMIVLGAYLSIPVPAVALPFGIYVPANPYVPFTLQTLGVLFSAAALGFRRGLAASSLYLLLGIVGLPVFAAGSDGVHASGLDTIAVAQDGRFVLGPTGGYLIGFVLASGLVGRLAELGWDRTIRGALAAMVLGNALVYVVGLPWLSVAAGLDVPRTLAFGLWPFVPWDVLKLALAAGLLPAGWWLVRRRSHDL